MKSKPKKKSMPMRDTGLEPDRLAASLLALLFSGTLLWLFVNLPDQGMLLETRRYLAANLWAWLPFSMLAIVVYLQAWLAFYALMRGIFSRMFCLCVIRRVPDNREGVDFLEARIFSLPVSKVLKADLFLALADEKPKTFGKLHDEEPVIQGGEKSDD